jgi:hypothetical protein
MPVKFQGHWFNRLQRQLIGRVRQLPPALLDLDGCLCQPLSPLPGAQLRLSGGIFNADGEYVAASGLVTSGRTVVGPAEGALPKPVETLPGRSLYLGVCHYHYGHFLTETLSRLWAFSREQLSDFDHILILPLNGHVPQFVRDLFHSMKLQDRLRVVAAPCNLEAVCIPGPAIQYPGRVHRQVAAIPKLFAHIGGQPETEQPLYISRTAVTPGHHRVVVGEDRLERALAASGVRIFHPQRHSVMDQIATLRAHRNLIGFAGSALHTLIPAGGGHVLFAYTARQVPAVFPLVDLALGNDATYIRARRKQLPGMVRLPVGFAPQLIDAREILARLRESGLIKTYDLADYGTPGADAKEVRRHNTAVLLRRVLELSQSERSETCHAEIEAFRRIHELDDEMLRHARRESSLLRRYFPPG